VLATSLRLTRAWAAPARGLTLGCSQAKRLRVPTRALGVRLCSPTWGGGCLAVMTSFPSWSAS